MEKLKKIRPLDMAMEQIEWYIKENQLKPHEKLPSEREMCTLWQMNRSTLHAAIQQLVEERKLYSIKGSGTLCCASEISERHSGGSVYLGGDEKNRIFFVDRSVDFKD